MKVNFYCDDDKLSALRVDLDIAQNYLNSSLGIAESVYGQIQDRVDWVADSQKVMAALLDILVQYHKDLSKTESPLDQAIEELNELQRNSHRIYENCSELLDIETIV